MTEHEDLVAEAHEHIDKVADDAPVSARQAILTGKVEDQRMSLVARLVHALEKVTAERDVLSSLREQMSLRLRYVEGKREQAEAERDGLAAVVHYLRLLTDGSDWNGGQVDDILDAAPSVALDRVKAEARAEGVREARSYIQRIAPAGLVDRAAVLADLEIAAERLSQGIHANGRDRIEKGESNDQ